MKQSALAVIALVTLASCVQSEVEPDVPAVSTTGKLGQDFGNAVSHNTAQQILDPVPANVRAGAPAMDGARAAGAYERYRSGKVIAPEALETTSFGTER